MEDSPGFPLAPQRRRGADESPGETDGTAAAEPSAEPAAGSDPDDDNGWLPV